MTWTCPQELCPYWPGEGCVRGIQPLCDSLSDLTEPGQPQCGATPPGKDRPVCARPPDHHAGRHGRHESADYMWNDRGWLQPKTPGRALR